MNGPVRHLLAVIFPFTEQLRSSAAVDDSEGIDAVDRYYGALLVASLRALDEQGLLTETNPPNLHTALKSAAAWGDYMVSNGIDDFTYNRVLKGYGLRLFGSRTEDEWKEYAEGRNVAFQEFLKSMDAKSRKKGALPYPEADAQDKGEEDSEEQDEMEVDEEADGEAEGKGNATRRGWFEGATEEDANYEDPLFDLDDGWANLKPNTQYSREKVEWEWVTVGPEF